MNAQASTQTDRAVTNHRWEKFARKRVEGVIGVEAYLEAFPKCNGRSRNALRVRACELERRPEVADTIGRFRAQAMGEAVVEGAALVRRLAQEVTLAGNVENAQAIKKALDDLETDARAAGVDGLQVRASVAALRIKFWEVLGRIRLQALGHLTRYASRTKGTNGSADTPVKVQINYALPTESPPAVSQP